MNVLTLFAAGIVLRAFSVCGLLLLRRGAYKTPPTVLPLELILIPLLPFVRSQGRFRFCLFRHKWLYWPCVRSRRIMRRFCLKSQHSGTIVYVDVDTGETQYLHAAPIKPPSSTRFVVVSDTHLLHSDLDLPIGDVDLQSAFSAAGLHIMIS